MDKCLCGKKPANECEPWEPGCGLGNSAEHARVVPESELPAELRRPDAPVPGARCKLIESCKKCQHCFGRQSCGLAGRDFDGAMRPEMPPDWCPLPIYRAPAQAEPVAPDYERMRHIANEWADLAVNGVQWLRNLKDGIGTIEEAHANMEKCLAHCRQVNDAPGRYGRSKPEPAAQPQAEPGAPLMLGRTYTTQVGGTVKMVAISNAGSDHETMIDQWGVHRYSRRHGDIGRITGSAHDYSHPANIARAPAAQPQPQPVNALLDAARKVVAAEGRSTLRKQHIDALRAALAAAEAAQTGALTDEQMAEGLAACTPYATAAFRAGVRFAERAHGIQAGAKGGEHA